MKSIFALVIVCFSVVTFADEKTEKKNKEVVEAFYNMAFREHKPVEAIDLYGGN